MTAVGAALARNVGSVVGSDVEDIVCATDGAKVGIDVGDVVGLELGC